MESIKERIDAAKQKDFITVEECALLVGVSERTVWRRLSQMERVVRDGRIVRLHRSTAVRFFLKYPTAQSL
jgi:DeoR/GlpR family transcriptional regulator of sugar metabolism